MKRNSIAMVVGLLMVLGAVNAWAQCPRGEGRGFHGKHGPMMLEKLKEELNLTAEQVKEIEQLHEEMMAESKPLRDQMKALREKMHKLWSEDYPNEGEIIAVQREMSALRLQLSELRTQMKLDMMEVLNAEQREKFRSMKGKFRGKRGHGRHGKGGCGDCPYASEKK